MYTRFHIAIILCSPNPAEEAGGPQSPRSPSLRCPAIATPSGADGRLARRMKRLSTSCGRPPLLGERTFRETFIPGYARVCVSGDAAAI